MGDKKGSAADEWVRLPLQKRNPPPTPPVELFVIACT